MSKSIFNNQFEGQYDFFTQLIELNNEAFHFNEEDVLRIINTEEPLTLKNKELKFYTTYLHELIHFFDCNSTLWGMEFTARIYRHFKNPASEQAFEVISLNDTEIAMHHFLLDSKLDVIELDFDLINYELDYSKALGTHINFHYIKFIEGKKVIVHTVPLSMLALLEGHAYSQEQLFNLKAFQFQNDFMNEKLLNSGIKSLINKANRTEYTCILALVFQLFPDLSLKNKLELLVILPKLVLNAPTLMISGVPTNLLEKVFQLSHPVLISAINMELSRGMNRSTFLLICIIYLAYYNDTNTLPKGENFIDEIEEIILEVFRYDFDKSDYKNTMTTFWEMEYDHLCKHLKESNVNLTYNTAMEMKEKPWYFSELRDIKVPSFFLSSCEIITPKNNLNINIEEHSDNICGAANHLENKLKETPPKKSHLDPFIAHDFLANMKQGHTGVTFYPEFFKFR